MNLRALICTDTEVFQVDEYQDSTRVLYINYILRLFHGKNNSSSTQDTSIVAKDG